MYENESTVIGNRGVLAGRAILGTPPPRAARVAAYARCANDKPGNSTRAGRQTRGAYAEFDIGTALGGPSGPLISQSIICEVAIQTVSAARPDADYRYQPGYAIRIGARRDWRLPLIMDFVARVRLRAGFGLSEAFWGVPKQRFAVGVFG